MEDDPAEERKISLAMTRWLQQPNGRRSRAIFSGKASLVYSTFLSHAIPCNQQINNRYCCQNQLLNYYDESTRRPDGDVLGVKVK